ncbi:putative leader peptide [Pseudonocardia sp. GCM10023141]
MSTRFPWPPAGRPPTVGCMGQLFTRRRHVDLCRTSASL